MVKMVSFSNEVYANLKAVKGSRSFSEVVAELLEKKRKQKKSIKKFIGIWKDDSEYWENFKKEIRKSRNSAKMREVNL